MLIITFLWVNCLQALLSLLHSIVWLTHPRDFLLTMLMMPVTMILKKKVQTWELAELFLLWWWSEAPLVPI